MPNINSTLISNLFEQAEQSTLQQHLAAAVVHAALEAVAAAALVDSSDGMTRSTRSVPPELNGMDARALLSTPTL